MLGNIKSTTGTFGMFENGPSFDRSELSGELTLCFRLIQITDSDIYHWICISEITCNVMLFMNIFGQSSILEIMYVIASSRTGQPKHKLSPVSVNIINERESRFVALQILTMQYDIHV